jgi:hypothetical protein
MSKGVQEISAFLSKGLGELRETTISQPGQVPVAQQQVPVVQQVSQPVRIPIREMTPER